MCYETSDFDRDYNKAKLEAIETCALWLVIIAGIFGFIFL